LALAVIEKRDASDPKADDRPAGTVAIEVPAET
jgi:hypothetical protein